MEKEFNDYLKLKEDVSKKRDVSLMDMATIVAKYLKKEGKLDNLEVSEENNACSVYVDVEVEDFEGKKSIEQWLLMFKNETHNPVSYTHLDVYKRQSQYKKIHYQKIKTY